MRNHHYPELPSNWKHVRAVKPTDLDAEICAVYIVVDRKFRCKYVGKTKRLPVRFREHRATLMALDDYFGWVVVDESNLDFCEAWFIATLRPYRNFCKKHAKPRATNQAQPNPDC